MLPISVEVLTSELDTARSYIDKWLTKIREEGLPGIDVPVSGDPDVHLERFVREMCNELRIVSGKCDTLAQVVLEAYMQGG